MGEGEGRGHRHKTALMIKAVSEMSIVADSDPNHISQLTNETQCLIRPNWLTSLPFSQSMHVCQTHNHPGIPAYVPCAIKLMSNGKYPANVHQHDCLLTLLFELLTRLGRAWGGGGVAIEKLSRDSHACNFQQ